MPQAPDTARAGSTGARAPLVADPATLRHCPAPGCGRRLTDRQEACSGKCRAALSRRRRKARLLALARELVEALEAL